MSRRNVSIPMPDCRSCGACCGPSTDDATHVQLFDVDVKRLSPAFRRSHVVEGFGEDSHQLRTKRGSSGTVCVALRGSVGHRVLCAIYERRPTLCEQFKPGSKLCLESRRAIGIGEAA